MNVENPTQTAELVEALRLSVQQNCDIADARHSGDYQMCTYLMKMRELFRWEQGLGFGERLPKDDVGDWLVAREARWEEVAEREFVPVRVNGDGFDPFDNEAINRAIAPMKLVYSGGLVQGGRPNFYLARLECHEERVRDFALWISDRELARGLYAPPAMNRGRAIFLRREALRRYLWETYEIWGWSRPDNALARAFASYPFERDVEVAVEWMAENELAAAREHEIGEYEAGCLLGDDWNRMLLALAHTPAEIQARAIRDLIADCSRTLPTLVAQGEPASIHFLIGNFSNMRKSLSPALLRGYQDWVEGRTNSAELSRIAQRGADHWRALAREMLAIFRREPADLPATIRQQVEQNTF